MDKEADLAAAASVYANECAKLRRELANTRAILRELAEAVEEYKREVLGPRLMNVQSIKRLDRALAAAREMTK